MFVGTNCSLPETAAIDPQDVFFVLYTEYSKASPFKYGTEFQINTTTAGSQLSPTITGLADGRFVASWTDTSASGGDTSGNAVRAQIFNADGSKAGAEFLVNTTTDDSQLLPTITGLENGGFVVSWADRSRTPDDTSAWAVRAQVFNGDGSPSGDEFMVNTTTADNQFAPTIAGMADGGFVVSWWDDSALVGDTSGTAIRAQVFNSDGSPSGAEILVNTTVSADQNDPAIAGLTDGRFVVSWTDESATGGDTEGSAVRAQIFNGDGTPSGAEFLVNTTTTGNFGHGNPVLDNQFAPAITGLADGRFVISWTDDSQTGDDEFNSAVRAQVFNADGSMSGGEFLVNTSVGGDESNPTITGLADGRFVVSWSEEVQIDEFTTDFSVRAQVFNIDGSKAGGEFLVNTTTTAEQSQPTIAALADGRFVVSWQDLSLTGDDNSGYAVRGQIFDPRESAVTLNGTLLDDDFVGTRYGDEMSGSIGDDAILGRSGDDNIFGEWGDDDLRGNFGNDRLYGGEGNDTLRGGFGADQLFGGEGNDTLNGGFGLDLLQGGTGSDLYFVDNIGDVILESVNEGNDWVRSATISLDLANYANVENLRLIGSSALDLIGDGQGNDLMGNSGANELRGLGGSDALSGGGGGDKLYGGGNRDNLFGQNGKDKLFGDAGNDTLTGGAGTDTFVFNDVTESGPGVSSRDRIKDFNQAQGDIIDLSGIDAGPAAGDQSFVFIGTTAFSGVSGELRFEQTGGDTIVQGDIDGDSVADFEVLLDGLITLGAGDFIL